MTLEQRALVDHILREAPFDLGGNAAEQRPLLEAMLTSQPLPDDVRTSAETLGGVPVIRVSIDGTESTGTILHLHGGGFALGSAESSIGLAAELARRTGSSVISVDYRLAPEHPFPAASLDATAAYTALREQVGSSEHVVVSGESAGGALALELLLTARAAGTTMPAAVVLMSPMSDLTASGASFTSKATADPNITATAIRNRVDDYLRGTGIAPADPRVSPLFADLTGLPPLLIQAGTHEVLLDDSTRLAAKAAVDDVSVVLDISSGVPHVFQAFAGMLDEADAALSRIAHFISNHPSHPM